MILDDIVAYKRQELEEAKKELPLRELVSAAAETPPAIDFLDLHAKTPGVKIISEIKKASPSKGVIRDDFDHFSIAREYEASGAFALSVLTDRKFFEGDISYLSDIRAHSELPILRKDFTIDPYQVYEARRHGADLVLLIVAVLDRGEIEEYLSLARSLGMNCIVEVHGEEELETALLAGSEIIGINNRDLRTFDVSLDVSKRLSGMVPEGKILISESGISSVEDMAGLMDFGIDTFLIGETFMKAKSPGEALRGFLC
ncbi:MAG: indole-3-glycerol phosphate synthase TrpC [Candidatus Dadabacteria bacterium]|nr:indole-3-glycerol phosphate synthase TrpC [Candidatus Dadabacteria bacterium]MYA49066.1 indole-3-glycerol phosphate synthase TrpC [Candidatus Dadabacteria bacterium]MYG83304.1 indole-3-glycerol phosphate synthase TrpC [Candidatus Dadabacteria bacterium]MYK48883.1 indole-3-glycerol phosphate synthase TrpC [Candidatus Dadabacteria bacterium]